LKIVIMFIIESAVKIRVALSITFYQKMKVKKMLKYYVEIK